LYQYPPRGLASTWAWIAGLAVLCLLARASSAAVFYVRAGGSDDADGLSPAAAFATINHAALSLRNPGDQVIVGQGTFKEGDITPAHSGFAGHLVEFIADTSGTLTGDGAGPVEITPPAPRTTGFLLAGRHHIRIDGFTIVGAVDAGIQVRSDVTGLASSDVTIRNTVVRDCVKRGLDITAGGVVAVDDNVAVANGSSGISITGLAGTGATLAVSNNQAIQNGSHGLFVSNAIGGVIVGNQAEDNAGSGILMRASSNVSIDGNMASGNQDGIAAGVGANGTDLVTDVSINGNDAHDNAQAGIDVVASGSVTVEQNSVTNSGTTGVLIVGDGGSTAAIRSNEIQSNGTDGVSVRGTASLTVSDNNVQANKANGLRVRQSSTVTITDNMITNNQNTGMDAVANGSVAFKRNTVTGNGAVGASVVADTNATIRVDLSANTLQHNAGGGVFVAGASAGTVADNVVEDDPADGIVVRLSTRLSFVRNRIARSDGIGLAVGVGTEQSGGSDFVLLGNQITASAKGGISVFATGNVTVSANTVTHSGQSGVSVQAVGAAVNPTLSNNTIGTSGGHGIFLLGSDGGVVQNNVVFSNGDTGITLRSAPDLLLVNNLVYANVHDGLAIGTNDLAAPRAKILHNTAYANGGWGLLLGTNVAPSPGATVVGNIFELNRGDTGQGGGIAVARSSTCGYVAGFNINVDGYGEGTPRNDYDIVADPLFLSPAGRDRQLGGDAFADDDFRLQQGRGGQTVQSPAVDAGAAPIAEIGLTGTTARGGAADLGVVDIGYHYGAAADQHITVPTPYMPIFVRQTGRSANDGLAPEHALASIQDAAQRADAGGTVVVGPGTYAEGDIHPDQNRGPVTFFADVTGVATGDVPGVVWVDATGGDTGFVLLNACNVTVRGFAVSGAVSAGIQVRDGSDDATVRDNIVFSNQRRGIEVLSGDAPVIDNNLVYANGTGGIHVEQSNNGNITNNTVYANGDVGVLVGGSGTSGPALGVAVLRNIVAANGSGVRVQPNSFMGYYTGFNVVPDGFPGNTPRADSDFVPAANTQLFIDPQGPGGALAGASFLDDDFHLTPSSANPARGIDYGETNTLIGGSTRSDAVPNAGAADAGYHYPFLRPGPLATTVPRVVFVRASGSDRNSGLSSTRAFASIERALEAISGDGFVVIGPGTYREPRLLVGATGRRNGMVVLWGDEGGQLTGDGAGKVIVDAGGHAAPTVAGPALIDGLTLTGARGPGLRVLRGAHSVTLRNSTLCGNTGDGVTSAGDAVSVVNNLICGNGGVGISARLRGARAGTQLLNNTVAGNIRQGIVIGETGAPVSRTLAYNNVVSGNGGTGITAHAVRSVIPATGNNLNTDGYGARTFSGAGDLNVAPQFVGGVVSKQIGCEAVQSLRVSPTSPVIDGGARTAIELGLGTRSVTTTGNRDTGPTDLGYHYRQ
jgi:parallel beta-helix repeat protein